MSEMRYIFGSTLQNVRALDTEIEKTMWDPFSGGPQVVVKVKGPEYSTNGITLGLTDSFGFLHQYICDEKMRDILSKRGTLGDIDQLQGQKIRAYYQVERLIGVEPSR
jgi:hypothetical protein